MEKNSLMQQSSVWANWAQISSARKNTQGPKDNLNLS